MGSSPTTPVVQEEPAAIQAVNEERMKLASSEGAEFQKGVDEHNQQMRLATEYATSHADVVKWIDAEIEKLPLLSSGEMSYRDPAKVKAVRLKGADRHIALADKHLPQVIKSWQEGLASITSRFSAFYDNLIAADYASEAKNYATKKALADAQIMVLARVGAAAKMSRDAYEEAASWAAKRKMIEKQP